MTKEFRRFIQTSHPFDSSDVKYICIGKHGACVFLGYLWIDLCAFVAVHQFQKTCSVCLFNFWPIIYSLFDFQHHFHYDIKKHTQIWIFFFLVPLNTHNLVCIPIFSSVLLFSLRCCEPKKNKTIKMKTTMNQNNERNKVQSSMSVHDDDVHYNVMNQCVKWNKCGGKKQGICVWICSSLEMHPNQDALDHPADSHYLYLNEWIFYTDGHLFDIWFGRENRFQRVHTSIGRVDECIRRSN